MPYEDPGRLAAQIDADLQALPVPNTANQRAVRRQYQRQLQPAEPAFVLDLARTLIGQYDQRWIAYELIAAHKGAFPALGRPELEEFGRGINSWHSVDAFARTLSGPAWLKRQIADGAIQEWAGSEDLWWRRAALVSTVALNMRSHGGRGDVPRTLAICRPLAADHEDMVVKALSWALRELVPHDPEAVAAFLAEYDDQLAARVKREVNNKLTTGLKNPK